MADPMAADMREPEAAAGHDGMEDRSEAVTEGARPGRPKARPKGHKSTEAARGGTSAGKATKGKSSSALAHFRLALAAKRKKDFEAARKHFKAAGNEPDVSFSMKLTFANFLLHQKDYANARRQFAELLETDPECYDACVGLGLAARKEGAPAEALSAFRRAADVKPHQPELQQRIADTLVQLDRYDEADDTYRKLLSANPTWVRAIVGLSRTARRRGDLTGTLAHLKSAAALAAGNEGIRKEVAKTLLQLERADEAEGIFVEALSELPDQRSAIFGLLKILRGKNDWPGALRLAQSALEDSPDDQALKVEVGDALSDLVRYDEAEPFFRQVLTVSSENVGALCGLAHIEGVRGNSGTALAYLERARRVEPENPRVRRASRDLSKQIGEFDWKRDFETAVATIRKGSGSAHALLAAAGTLFRYGVTDILHPVLGKLEKTSMTARRLAVGVRELERLGLAQSIGLNQTGPDPGEFQLEEFKGFFERPAQKSDTLLIAFSGVGNQMSFTLSLMHRFLRKTGVNLVYVRDVARNHYLGGIVGLGADFQETAQAFRELRKRYRAKKLLMLGNCGGCLGALRHGATLGADGVLGISPAFRVQRAELFKPEHVAHIRELRDKLPPGHKTLDTLLAESPPVTTLIYGAQYKPDAADAESVSRFPNITLVPMSNSADHNSMRPLLTRRLLEPLLLEFAAKGSVSRKMQEQIRTSGDS